MALTKVTKHTVYGSQLIAHYGVDINDATSSSSSYVNWGQSVSLTPQYADSHLEIVFTGTMFTSSNMSTSTRHGNLRLTVNGTQEYLQTGVIGGNLTNQGEQRFSNPRHQEHNGRQQFHYNNFGKAVYMNHIHAPGTTNAQSVQVQFSCDSGAYSLQCKDGFLTCSEIAGNHYNLT
jgi:hypothetical protein